MEPPAKRLRILQSVEVDETNPDYIEAKQKQQQKFKGRLERIFDKYGNMHESMSDEIDFKTGKVVVDRGHIRRVQRQMKRKGPSLIDDLLEPSHDLNEASQDEGEEVESEDELAPTQTIRRKKSSVDANEEDAQPLEQPNAAIVATTPHTGSKPLLQGFQLPNTPNPARDLYQQIQQTPLDQQVQAALFANLNQIQAAQQALASLLSILQNPPNAPSAQAPFPAAFPQPPIDDNVRPAADPKWYFPPISAVKATPRIEDQRSSPPLAQTSLQQINDSFEVSSPLVSRRKSPKVRIELPSRALQRISSQQSTDEGTRSSHSLPASSRDSVVKPGADLVPVDPPSRTVQIGKSKTAHKYKFTAEDDVYISEKKQLHNFSFREIKAGKAKWSDWPLSAFHNRWRNHIKGKCFHLQEPPRNDAAAQHEVSAAPELDEHFFSTIEIPETSSIEHRLPTPSSLEQEVAQIERAVIPSSSHFDDDELELLSLAGADVGDAFHRDDFYGDDDYPTPDEPLPSIEGAEFRNEDELQLEMLKSEQSPTPGLSQPKILPSTIPETQESVITTSTPPQKPNVIRKTQPEPTNADRAASNCSDIDLLGGNNAPVTPCAYIKRESVTPQATRILCSSPVLKTPRPLLQSSALVAKSTGKLNRRAYLNDVKKSWTKKGGAKTPGSQKRRKSLNESARGVKRAWVQVGAGESEDELAV